jgi:hypothetical protein
VDRYKIKDLEKSFLSLNQKICFRCLLVFVFGLGFGAKANATVDCTATATTGVPQIECEALMAFCNSTDGPGWTASKTNWNTSSAVSTRLSIGFKIDPPSASKDNPPWEVVFSYLPSFYPASYRLQGV